MLIEIPDNRATSVKVAAGATIRCMAGKVWLTQEGDARDYCVPAGVTFCADRSGQAVLSAIEGPSTVIVQASAAEGSRCVPGTLRIDSIEELTRRARAEQAAYVAHVLMSMAASAFTAIQRLVRAALRRRTKLQSAC